MIMRRLIKKRGQIWIETVLYTLIGIVIIGIVLAVAKPKVDRIKDDLVIEQAIEAFGNIDKKIYEVQVAAGNRRIVDLKIGKGELIVDMENDKISWLIDSSFEYSEVGVLVPLGNLNVTTTGAGPWQVVLERDYGVDIRYNNENKGVMKFDSAPIPYNLAIENGGRNPDSNIIIDIREA